MHVRLLKYLAGSVKPPAVIVVVLLLGGVAYGQTPLAGELEDVPRAVSGSVVEALMFYVFAAAVVLSALGVCVAKNVVRMATWLFITLGSVAVLYFLLSATFLGAIQLIVYVGGTLILLVFGVMLTSKSPWVRFEIRRSEVVTAAVVAIAIFSALTAVVTNTSWRTGTSDEVVGASLGEFGKQLLTTYLVPFEVASVLLLVVMIGAAYLAKQESD